MRIIDYFNLFAMVINLILILAAFYISGIRKAPEQDLSAEPGSGTFDVRDAVPVIVLLAIAAFLRFWNLEGLPMGLNQDEASIGYEAYSIAEYGIDRYGYHYPIYPITWGSGGGSPLLIYQEVLTTRLFGSNVTVLRGTVAFCGVVTLYLFWRFLLKGRNKRTALAGLLLLMLFPWSIMFSRWALDCNIVPMWVMLASYVFLIAVQKQSTGWYVLAAALFSLCMYSYGSCNVIIPIAVLLLCIAGLRHHVLSWKQIFLSFLAFVIVFFPLLVFYAANFLLPSFSSLDLPFFSIEKFSASRASTFILPWQEGFWSKLWQNFVYLIQLVTTGTENELIVDQMPSYMTMYRFTFPVTLAGLIFSIRNLWRKRKEKGSLDADAVMMTIFAASVLCGLIIEPSVNRLIVIFVPLSYWNVRGMEFLWRSRKKLAVVSLILFLAGSASFLKDYATRYNTDSQSAFMHGYGPATAAANAKAKEDETGSTLVYSTHEGLSAPYMIALYYCKTDPNVFIQTVRYRDLSETYLTAVSFDCFVFELPEDIQAMLDAGESPAPEDLDGSILIVTSHDAALFDTSLFHVEIFDDFAVVYANE